MGVKPLHRCCIQPVEEKELDASVHSYLEEGCVWRWEAFSNSLSASSLLQVAAHPTDYTNVESDLFSWLESRGNPSQSARHISWEQE